MMACPLSCPALGSGGMNPIGSTERSQITKEKRHSAEPSDSPGS